MRYWSIIFQSFMPAGLNWIIEVRCKKGISFLTSWQVFSIVSSFKIPFYCIRHNVCLISFIVCANISERFIFFSRFFQGNTRKDSFKSNWMRFFFCRRVWPITHGWQSCMYSAFLNAEQKKRNLIAAFFAVFKIYAVVFNISGGHWCRSSQFFRTNSSRRD